MRCGSERKHMRFANIRGQGDRSGLQDRDANERAPPRGTATRVRRQAGSTRAPAASDARAGESLTPTEMRIAELIATGLDGKQISAQLFISRSTVQTHVSHALAKLGLHSRLELAAELTRRNQPM